MDCSHSDASFAAPPGTENQCRRNRAGRPVLHAKGVRSPSKKLRCARSKGRWKKRLDNGLLGGQRCDETNTPTAVLPVNQLLGVSYAHPLIDSHRNQKMKMILKGALGCAAHSLLMPWVLICAQATCITNQPTAVELPLLQGTWEGVVVGDESHEKITITITDNSFHFHRDTNFWFETTITLPEGTDPRQLYATIKDSAPGQENSVGKVVVAIFKIEDGTLTLAAIGDGDEETPKSFEAAEDKGLTRYELRKVQPPKKNTAPPKTK